MEDAFIAIVVEARQARTNPCRQVERCCVKYRGVSHTLDLRLRSNETGCCQGRWSCARRARQVVRDPSSIAIGIVLPVMLILLFGYGFRWT